MPVRDWIASRILVPLSHELFARPSKRGHWIAFELQMLCHRMWEA